MKLIEETRGRRVYEREDGTFYENRAAIMGRNAEVSAKVVDDFPEMGQMTAEMLVDIVKCDAAKTGLELFPGGDIRTERFTVQPVLWDDETDEPVRDENGEMVEDPDAEPFELIRFTVEFGYWPKLEEES